MTGQLPPDCMRRATALLLPHMCTVEERDAWLAQAFYTTEQRLYHQIAREGKPIIFVTNCIKTLLDFGCLTSGQHALSLLLDVMRLVVGIDEQTAIDQLVADMNATCGEVPPPTTPPIPTPAPPGTRPIQTIETPLDTRTPTVFISYSHRDTEFVQQLMDSLNAAGHACWVDTTDIKGGDEWIRAITEGINNSYAFISVVSEAANASKWVRREFLWAEDKEKPIFPVFAEECGLPIYMLDLQALPLHTTYDNELERLLTALPTPTIRQPEGVTVTIHRPPNQRALELAYLDYLQLEEQVNIEKFAREYTPMRGTTHTHLEPETAFEPVLIRPEYAHLRDLDDKVHRGEAEIRHFEDIIAAIYDVRRGVLLGEPGSGKTTTLWKFASSLMANALKKPEAPIPVLVRLGRWTDPDQPFRDFIAGQLGDLGLYLDELLSQKRAVLLLDGLNEIPVAQRKDKDPLVRAFVNEHPDLMAVISCRELDYTLDQAFDRIVITPLDALRIREFITRYLGEDAGAAMFWQMAGEEAHLFANRFQERFATKLPDWRRTFWLERNLPEDIEWEFDLHNYRDMNWRRWLNIRNAPGSLLALAENPYMLLMLTDVYKRRGDLPDNRGQLFARFVQTLLARETEQRIVSADQQDRLLRALGELAYEMQVQRSQADDGNAVTVLPRNEAERFLPHDLLYLANSASILDVGAEVRFSHQLLQEYFAAVHMQAAITAGELRAADIWPPDRWWQRANWEEVAILLAGLYSNDCTPALDWFAAANPEVAAQCIARGGAHVPPETLARYQSAWLPRLIDLTGDPQPQARAAVGRALGLLDLDNRPGVGLDENGLPDIEWVEIPGGTFLLGSTEEQVEALKQQFYRESFEEEAPQQRVHLDTFYMAMYPITYRQFQAFLDAPDGFQNPRWWQGLAANDDHKREPGEQAFSYWNHPRERVSWYDAVAFCRWLSDRLGFEVRLPTEIEGEKAARGPDGLIYPYGNTFDAAKGNTGETGIRQTSAVGIFPQGETPYGLLDMSGNVYEWCMTEWGWSYEDGPDAMNNTPSNTPSNTDIRVLRGGDFGIARRYARAACRNFHNPGLRDFAYGFRVCCVHPP